LTLSGSTLVKAVHRTLVKLTPGEDKEAKELMMYKKGKIKRDSYDNQTI